MKNTPFKSPKIAFKIEKKAPENEANARKRPAHSSKSKIRAPSGEIQGVGDGFEGVKAGNEAVHFEMSAQKGESNALFSCLMAFQAAWKAFFFRINAFVPRLKQMPAELAAFFLQVEAETPAQMSSLSFRPEVLLRFVCTDFTCSP